MKNVRRFAVLGAGILCLTLAALAGIAGAATGTVQTTVGSFPDGAIGVAVSPTQLIVSHYCSLELSSVSDAGAPNAAVTHYSSIPLSPPGCTEIYLAFSPGANGWPAGELYATDGNQIWQVAPGGGTDATLFSFLGPNCDNTADTVHTGITFDTVGTFGNDMIVTCVSGQVFRVNPAGTATQIADTHLYLEGPAVVPAAFGPLGGQIFVGNESPDLVVAISPAGVVTPVAGFKLPESVEVIPPNPCNFGTSGGSLFGAMYDPGSQTHDVWKWSASDLIAAGPGNVLVTSEGASGIGLLTFSGGVYTINPFSNDNNIPHEGSDILGCAPTPPPNANIQITPATADNPVGTNHVLTITVNAVNGTLDGGPHTATASIVSGPGNFVGSPTCTYTGGGVSASCTVTITSTVAGQTTVSATSNIVVNGTTFTRTTNTADNTAAGGSGNAVKNWLSVGFCPLTQGYWKNHPSAWPVDTLKLGTVTYTKAQLLDILGMPVKGDASIDLAHQLIAAKLNIAAGADQTPISATITDADALLGSGTVPENVKSSSTLGQKMVADASKLDQFNQRQLTPGCPAES